MGRKSSAKAQGRDAGAHGSEPPETPRSSTPLAAAVIIALVAVVGGYAFVRSGRDAAPPPADHTAHDQWAAQPAGEPRWAKLGPHKRPTLPPLPTQPYAPPRPADVVRAAYLFAAEHP